MLHATAHETIPPAISYRVIDMASGFDLTALIGPIYCPQRVLDECHELERDNPHIDCTIQRRFKDGPWRPLLPTDES